MRPSSSNALASLAAIGIAIGLPTIAAAQADKPVVTPPGAEQGSGKPVHTPAQANTEGKMSADQIASVVANPENGMEIVRDIESYPRISVIHINTFEDEGQRDKIMRIAREHWSRIGDLQESIENDDELINKLKSYNVHSRSIIGVGETGNDTVVFFAE